MVTTATRRLGLILLAVSAAMFVALYVVPEAANAAVARGIADPTLTQPGAKITEAVQAEAMQQIGPKLRARFVRFVVNWAAAEPTRSVLDETYMAGVDRAVALAHANDLKVIITFAYPPKWASDSRFWYANPFQVKGYDRRYAMKTDLATLAAWKAFCRKVAARWHAWGYEVWNEPNVQMTLYPQATAQDASFGAHVYIKMLKWCSVGIRQGDPQAKVLAGGTSPRGAAANAPLSGRRLMTSPQRFAKQIQAHRVGSYFDGYSHHPYTPGAAKNKWPEAAPRDPSTCVNLQNLGTLLKLFPSKPFYLTEYGYQTAASNSFSGQYVSPATQADYLRRAYSFAARYRQVKLLMWFLLDDWSPSGSDSDTAGFYTGLRYISQQKKPAWYVFAGGTSLTLTGPSSIPAGASATLQGVLTSATDGPIANRTLTVQARSDGAGWSSLGTPVTTDSLGAYAVTLKPTKSTEYRVVWPSVVTSSLLSVSVL